MVEMGGGDGKFPKSMNSFALLGDGTLFLFYFQIYLILIPLIIIYSNNCMLCIAL